MFAHGRLDENRLDRRVAQQLLLRDEAHAERRVLPAQRGVGLDRRNQLVIGGSRRDAQFLVRMGVADAQKADLDRAARSASRRKRQRRGARE